MDESDGTERVVATAAALEAIRRLRAAVGPLMFYQSGGCCDGSLPMCFRDGELIVGDRDLLLGTLDGCPFYIDARQFEAWKTSRLTLDVDEGFPQGFSLAAGDDAHFVTRTEICTGAVLARIAPPQRGRRGQAESMSRITASTDSP